jgi:hypothetical protein
MSNENLETLIKTMEMDMRINSNKQKPGVTNEMDDFWDDCINFNPNSNLNLNSNLKKQNPTNIVNSNQNNNSYSYQFNQSQNQSYNQSYYNNNNNSIQMQQTQSNKNTESNNNYNNDNIRKNNFQETKQSNNNNYNVSNTKNSNRSANHSLVNDLYNKFDIEEFVSPEEEEKNRLQKQKKEEALERCMMLYEKARIKNEVNKINFYKNIEIKDNMELNGCTFVPKINERKNKQEENLKLVYKNTNIYNRSLQWKENKHSKIEKNRRELDRGNEVVSRPPVNKYKFKLILYISFYFFIIFFI